MNDETKQPSKKTRERYDLFVGYYLQSFNATKAAVLVGYSEKQQGNRDINY